MYGYFSGITARSTGRQTQDFSREQERAHSQLVSVPYCSAVVKSHSNLNGCAERYLDLSSALVGQQVSRQTAGEWHIRSQQQQHHPADTASTASSTWEAESYIHSEPVYNSSSRGSPSIAEPCPRNVSNLQAQLTQQVVAANVCLLGCAPYINAVYLCCPF